MGMSTDAILYYGIEFTEDEIYDFWKKLEVAGYEDAGEGADRDFEMLARHKMEVLEALEGETGDDYYKRRRAVMDMVPCDVGQHQSYDYPIYFAYIKASYYRAHRGYPTDIPDGLTAKPEWTKQLKDFCTLMELPFREPKWQLCSLMG